MPYLADETPTINRIREELEDLDMSIAQAQKKLSEYISAMVSARVDGERSAYCEKIKVVSGELATARKMRKLRLERLGELQVGAKPKAPFSLVKGGK